MDPLNDAFMRNRYLPLEAVRAGLHVNPAKDFWGEGSPFFPGVLLLRKPSNTQRKQLASEGTMGEQSGESAARRFARSPIPSMMCGKGNRTLQEMGRSPHMSSSQIRMIPMFLRFLIHSYLTQWIHLPGFVGYQESNPLKPKGKSLVSYWDHTSYMFPACLFLAMR